MDDCLVDLIGVSSRIVEMDELLNFTFAEQTGRHFYLLGFTNESNYLPLSTPKIFIGSFLGIFVISLACDFLVVNSIK